MFLRLLPLFFSLSAFANISDFETYTADVLQKSQVPGVAVAIIKDGKVVLARGFGFRDVEAHLPVTENTIFAIGSTTKAMTATAAGILAREGKLNLRQPISEYLPDFKLKDAVATSQASLIDLMSHRTGLGRHDLVWYGFDDFPRSYFWDRLRYLEPSAGFREVWQYNNLMFMAAGYVVEKISGKTWEDFIHERVFVPLGMNSANFTVEETESSPDFARPYAMRLGRLARVKMRSVIGMAPAGAVNANVLDMAKWIQFNLGDGEPLLSAELLKLIHQPQMIFPTKAPNLPEFSYPSYTLGWTRQQYRGRDLIWHTGGIDGFLTFVGFLPEEKLGVVVFQNSDHAMVTTPLGFKAMDEVLQSSPIDWYTIFQPRSAEPVSKNYESAPPQRLLADYLGYYSHPAYGDAVISELNGALKITWHGFDFSLEPLKNGLFRITSPELGNDFEPAYFQIDGNGNIAELMLRLEPTVAAISFRRK